MDTQQTFTQNPVVLIRGMVRLARPSHWIKNIFVVLGILFGGATDFHVVTLALIAALAFCFTASGIYALNDICDREKDRAHPLKRHRPIASGVVSTELAGLLVAVFWLIGGLLAWYVSYTALACVLAYAALNVAYSVRIKHVVLLDVFCISLGFMLRILCGTNGLGIDATHWLLLCGFMLTLFLGFVKRGAEYAGHTQIESDKRRPVLDNYTPELLSNLTSITGTSAIVAYACYTVSPDTVVRYGGTNLIYSVPFVVYGIFRILYLLFRWKQGENASKELFKDKHLVVTTMLWILAVMLIGRRG